MALKVAVWYSGLSQFLHVELRSVSALLGNKLGDRSFSAAGPRLWNDLPPGLRRPGLTFDSFRNKLIYLSTGMDDRLDAANHFGV